MSQDLSVPAGWALVPIEPTVAMRDAGSAYHGGSIWGWAAMLEAAPSPPVGDDGWLPIEGYDESEGSVLVFADGIVGEAERNSLGMWFWSCEFSEPISATHFRPLPPPPQPFERET